MNRFFQEEITVAIIAGGKSTRFGSPKALAYLGDKRLIDYALETANNLSSNVVLSVARDHPFQNILNVSFVVDVLHNIGPAGGIYSVLKYSPSPWIAVLPCDMPLLSATIYQYLWQSRRGIKPVVAQSHSGLEPLVSLWNTSIIPSFESMIRQGIFSLHKLIETFDGIIVDLPRIMEAYQPHYFLNVNRKEDLNRIKEILASQE
ncbi:MAG: molybdenum cofactor guanylyltransferase [Calditrichaeota bacterium]|nr:MAG: molybdenum cofactor guanylyltransferase [Calditrichota bacterium]